MATQQSSPRKKAHWLLPGIAIAPLLMIGADIASVDGSKAHTLSLPFASLTYFSPLLAVVAYIAFGLLLRSRFGLFAWGAAFVLGITVVFVPRLIVTRHAQAVPLTRWLTPQEKAELQSRFPYPYVQFSTSGEGTQLLIRRSDYSALLVEFLRSIQAYSDT